MRWCESQVKSKCLNKFNTYSIHFDSKNLVWIHRKYQCIIEIIFLWYLNLRKPFLCTEKFSLMELKGKNDNLNKVILYVTNSKDTSVLLLKHYLDENLLNKCMIWFSFWYVKCFVAHHRCLWFNLIFLFYQISEHEVGNTSKKWLYMANHIR